MSTTIAVNLENNAVTQYLDFQFDGMCEFNGIPLGVNQDGVFRLDNKEEAVPWDATLATTNYQSPAMKRIRNALVGGIFTDDFTVKINQETYSIRVPEKVFVPRQFKVPARRNGTKSHFFSVTLSSSVGGFVAVSHIDATVVLLSTKSRS